MSNIYMEYLTESEREDLILEKEMDLIISDIDYIFTIYESTDDGKKKGAIKRLLEKIGKLIDKLIHEIIPNLLKKIKTKEETAEKEIKALPAPDLNNYVKKVYVKNGIEASIKVYDNLIKRYDELISKIDKYMTMNLSSEQLKKLNGKFNLANRNDFNIFLKRSTERNTSSDYNDTFVIAHDQNILKHINNQIEKISESIKYCEKLKNNIDNRADDLLFSSDDADNKINEEIKNIGIAMLDTLQVIISIINNYNSLLKTYTGYIYDVKIEYIAKDNDQNKTFAESVTEKDF